MEFSLIMIKKPTILFVFIILGLSGAVFYMTPYLLDHTRIGLEFKGGYEILYTAESTEPEKPVDREALLQTADILGKRANTLGVDEPEITLEGDDQIRVKLAGVSSSNQVKTIIKTDALPLKLTETYSQTVGGVLGQADFDATVQAGVIAFGLILAFIAVFYRIPGIISCFTLTVYLAVMLLVFNLLNATLSLAAIVAFVLGLGIAADSNILAYERIKEEIRKGKPIASALKDGEHNAFRTIMYSNIATLIGALVLFFVGIGPIKGFALTMIVSICVSIVCNVFLSRLLLNLLVRSNLLNKPAYFGVKIKPIRDLNTRFSFVKHRNKFFAISIIIAAAGIAMLYTSEINYDIDFKAGTALDIALPESIDQEEAASIMEDDAGIEPATVTIGGNDNNHIAARFDDVLESDDIDKIVGAFKEKYGDSVTFEENTSDPAVAEELKTKAIYVTAIAIAAIVAFVAIRFEWRFALGTFVAILNSAFFVISMFAIFKLEIDVTFIAAILTVIGFATINAVVVFDRIHENLKLSNVKTSQELASLVNQSIWQTITRSVNTVLAVVIASLCLYFFGAEPLQMFSLAILLGLVCGTYSSICISSQVWFLLKKKSLRESETSQIPKSD